MRKIILKTTVTTLLSVILFLCLPCFPYTAGAAENTPEQDSPQGSVSDYSDMDNWIQVPKPLKKADTFYICPTAYLTTDKEAPDICDISDPQMKTTSVSRFERDAGIFSEVTNVYAPFFRQASVYALQNKSAWETDRMLKSGPAEDVCAAMDYYFENYNEGRPFILAGYSQGSMILRIVLKEYMGAHPEYYERMIAAFVVGYSITENDLKEAPHLRFAEGPDDTGVIISYNTEGEGNGESQLVLDGAISINPLNWRRDETYAGTSQNLGSRITDAYGTAGIASPGSRTQSLIQNGAS